MQSASHKVGQEGCFGLVREREKEHQNILGSHRPSCTTQKRVGNKVAAVYCLLVIVMVILIV